MHRCAARTDKGGHGKVAAVEANFELSDEHKSFVELVSQDTGGVFYLTGPAGSGKSTLIEYLRKNIFRIPLIAAPTGVAALNVRGQTIHSLFQLPLGPLLPGDARLFKRYFARNKYEMFRRSDIIIIDEISMVRADTLDAIDTILRRLMRREDVPFGGKKILMVGDVFQLEPIVKGTEAGLLAEHYESAFFFDSLVMRNNAYETFTLKKVYRQSDERFLGLLNTVKMGESDEYTLEGLNERVQEDNKDPKTIYLCARKAEADAINNARMNALNSESRSYSGRVSGEFGINILPNDILLELKIGARVMFLKNDLEKRFVNGTLGTVRALNSQTIEIETDDGVSVEMETELWENIKYSYDETTKAISENVMGSFEQFAIKPAWAITIHKSQGLTFDTVNINLGSGAFASGMLYVALSRCRTLEGISLKAPLLPKDFKVNPTIINFAGGGFF